MTVQTETLTDTVKENADAMTHWACGVCYRGAPAGMSIVSLCGEVKHCSRGKAVKCPMCWEILMTGKAPCGHALSIPPQG